MSETVPPVASAPIPAPPTSPSTEAHGAGPAIGAPPPEAGGESPAPAVFSAPEAAPAVAEPTPPPSILSEAAAAEVPSAESAEPVPETKVADPPAAPTYEPFKTPEGIKLDDAKVGTFTGLLGELESKIAADPTASHAAVQELGQKLVDLYTSEFTAATMRYSEAYTQAQLDGWKQTQDQWRADFHNDPELGKNRAETTLTRMGALMDMYGQTAGPERLTALRDVLTNTGAGNNIETLRFVNWAARRLTETSRVVVPMVPRQPQQTGGKAERLYKNSIGSGAA